MKKILSLALALILTLSAFVLPASAAVPSEEVAEPYAAGTKCPNCTNLMVCIDQDTELISSGPAVTCEHGQSHWHYVYKFYNYYECASCGYMRTIITQKTLCEEINGYL